VLIGKIDSCFTQVMFCWWDNKGGTKSGGNRWK